MYAHPISFTFYLVATSLSSTALSFPVRDIDIHNTYVFSKPACSLLFTSRTGMEPEKGATLVKPVTRSFILLSSSFYGTTSNSRRQFWNVQTPTSYRSLFFPTNKLTVAGCMEKKGNPTEERTAREKCIHHSTLVKSFSSVYLSWLLKGSSSEGGRLLSRTRVIEPRYSCICPFP